jgi:membrane protein DedA with SNARE-associated domain
MHHLLDFLLRHGYVILGLWVLAEQAGIPIPAVPVLLAMGALTSTAYSFPRAMIVVTMAAVAADSAWYLIGRRKGHSVLNFLCRISLEPDSCVSSTRYWFKRLGAWTLVVAKFVPGLSTIATPMAGLTRMPAWKFLLADTTGAIVWGGSVMGIGFALRAQIEHVADIAEQLGGWMIVVVAGSIASWLAWKQWQRRRFIKSLKVARIRPEEVLDRLAEIAIVDLRPSS